MDERKRIATLLWRVDGSMSKDQWIDEMFLDWVGADISVLRGDISWQSILRG